MADDRSSDAPPIWDLLQRGQVDAAISAGNGWLNSEGDRDETVDVNIALSIGYLLKGDCDTAHVYAEGALDAALRNDRNEPIETHAVPIAAVGHFLRSMGVPPEGSVATLVEIVLCRLARDDEWLVRWARSQFQFAGVLLGNRRIEESLRALDELSCRARPQVASSAAGREIASLLARAAIHRTKAGVELLRREQELPPSVDLDAALRVALALEGGESRADRFDAALAATDLELALRSPAWRVAGCVWLAERLADTAVERVRVLARRGALATRDPDQRAAFLDAQELLAASDLRLACDSPDPALQSALLRVAAAALDVGERDIARIWLDLASASCEGAATDLLAAIGALDCELKLGPATRAGRAADSSIGETRARFERVVEALRVPGAVTPDRLDAFGRLTYVRVMQCLERDPGEALLVLERARVVRLALTTAAGLDATSAPAEGAGRASCHQPDRIPVLPRDVLALVFLWDNRNRQLGRFAVISGEDEPAVSFRWLACSERALHELIDAFEQLREGSRPPSDLASLLDEVLDETIDEAKGKSIVEFLDSPVDRRVIIIPHGPLAGLPLHMAIARRWPEVAVSYAPLLSLPRPERPAEQSRALFFQLGGPTTEEDPDRIRAEIKICGALLEKAGLTRDAGRAALESGPRANVPEVGLLHLVAHGAAVGAEGGQRWRAGRIALVDASGRPGQWTTTSILRAGRLHVDTVLLACCEGGRSTNPSRLRTSCRTAAWQVAFLESAGHGIAGALLAAGVGEVLAYPHHVRVECPLRFFSKILCRYAAARTRAGVPGDYDWARATAAVLQDPELSGGDSSLDVELPLIQHWVAPETLARRDKS